MPKSNEQYGDELEAQARTDLAAGRWRQARDGFKRLCKLDRLKFQPFLVEANVGLARAMLERGLISEAQQVLSYLRTIAPSTVVATLEHEIAGRLDALSGGPGTADSDPLSRLAAGNGTPMERTQWADELVVTFHRSAAAVSSPAAEQMAADCDIVHQALDSLCGGDAVRALDLVRPLRRASPFAHWRVFIRAIAAYQVGDVEKATRYFEELPADSVPGRARGAWQLVLGGGAHAHETGHAGAVLDAATTITGHAGWGRALVRADALWRAGRHTQSYRSLRDARTSFPSDTHDLAGALSDFYFNSLFSMREQELAKCEDYFLALDMNGRARRPTEQQRIRRTLALLLSTELFDDDDVAELRVLWDAFVREHLRQHGPNPALASVAWTWFGEMVSRSAPNPFSGATPQVVDADGAVAALNKAIELDPSNVAAHVLLASLLESLGRVRDHNRLLDTMAARFPNEKTVLVAAGAGCLKRKAFAKAADYFERACSLDRLDRTLPDHVVTARLLLARQHYDNRRLGKARAELDRTDALAVDSPDNLVRGRWTLAVRRGAMEAIFGEAAEAAAALDAARAAAPSPAQFLFCVRLAWSFYDWVKPFPKELQSALDLEAKQQPSVHAAADLVPIMDYWAAADHSRIHQGDVAWLRRYIKNAIKRPFNHADAALLFDRLRLSFDFRDVLRAIVARVLKQDSSDPLFRLYRDALDVPPFLRREQLETIRNEARRRGDVHAEQLAGRRIDVLQQQMVLPTWRPFEEEDEPGVALEPVRELATLDPGMEEELASLVSLLSMMPDEAIVEFRKRRPKGMPAHLFDALLEIARSGEPTPLPGTAAAGRRRQIQKRVPDSDQSDLF